MGLGSGPADAGVSGQSVEILWISVCRVQGLHVLTVLLPLSLGLDQYIRVTQSNRNLNG